MAIYVYVRLSADVIYRKGVSHTLKDIRPRAEEKARRKADELQERQSGDTVRPPGTGFETERARAKQALRDEVNAQNGQSVRKIGNAAVRPERQLVFEGAILYGIASFNPQRIIGRK